MHWFGSTLRSRKNRLALYPHGHLSGILRWLLYYLSVKHTQRSQLFLTAMGFQSLPALACSSTIYGLIPTYQYVDWTAMARNCWSTLDMVWKKQHGVVILIPLFLTQDLCWCNVDLLWFFLPLHQTVDSHFACSPLRPLDPFHQPDVTWCRFLHLIFPT